MEKSLAKLKKEYREAQGRATDLRLEIEKIEKAKKLPALINKYLNTYWKFKNTYGGNEETWNVYYKVIAIDDENTLKTISFETDVYGKIVIEERDVYCPPSVLETQITKQEYDKALNSLKKRITSL